MAIDLMANFSNGRGPDQILEEIMKQVEQLKVDLSGQQPASIGNPHIDMSVQQSNQNQTELEALAKQIESARESQRKAEAIMRNELGRLELGGKFARYE